MIADQLGRCSRSRPRRAYRNDDRAQKIMITDKDIVPAIRTDRDSNYMNNAIDRLARRLTGKAAEIRPPMASGSLHSHPTLRYDQIDKKVRRIAQRRKHRRCVPTTCILGEGSPAGGVFS